MSTFKVETGVEHYRIIGPDGEEGEAVSYEAIATLKIGREIYYCDGSENPDSEVYTVERITESRQEETEVDEVIFKELGEVEEEGDEEEGEDEEGEDEDEEEEVGPKLVG